MQFESFTIEVLEAFATYITYGEAGDLLDWEESVADCQLNKLANDYPGFVLSITDDRNEFGRCDWLNLRGATMTATVSYPVNHAA